MKATERSWNLPIDVIHAHFAYPSGAAAASLTRSWGIPYVLTLHGSDVNFFPSQDRLAKRQFVRAVRAAARVTAVSEALAVRTVAETGIKPIVLPIGLDLRKFSKPVEKTEARRILGLPENRTLLLFVGNLYDKKGVRELLAALAALSARNVLGVFVGAGPLSSLIEVSPWATLAGVQRNEAIPLFCNAADAMVLPSHAEGMPTVLVEAGAAGLPVIASNVGGIPELLGEDRGVLIQPKSAADIVQAAIELMDEPMASLEQAARLRSYVHHHYDADRNAALMVDIYREVIGGCYSISS